MTEGISIDEMAEATGEDVERVEESVQELVDDGYVEWVDDEHFALASLEKGVEFFRKEGLLGSGEDEE